MSQYQPGHPAPPQQLPPADPAQYSAPYGSYGHPQYVAAAAAPQKGLSITGLILGIASMIGFSYSGIVPIAGIIISAIALAKEPQGKTMAMWGLILSIASIVFAIIVGILLTFLGVGAALLPFIFIGSSSGP